ncbi:MAG: NAD-dependent epimerase/dehydratase family protein [Bacteroidales bacterium]|nr:NAD-dependent epimerase/dehydratase family protein [Bacteroidales bacterium]
MKPNMHHLVFLTGGTGLVGGHLLVSLYLSGKKIRALIRPTSSFEQLRLICRFYDQPFEALYDSVEWVYGNTLDYVGLCGLLTGVEDIYHCAAVVSFNVKNSKELLQTNIQGSSNMVDAALCCGVKRFCFISSIGALGNTKKGDFITEKTPRKDDGNYSVYSESKFRSELEVWRAQQEGLNTVILNPGIILGPGSPNKGSLLLIKTGRKGMPFYTKATTGYVDVRDVCQVGTELMDKNIFGKQFILVSENINNKELFSLIASEFDKKPPRFLAGKKLLNLSAFLSEIYGKITGKVPQLTKETVRSAQNPQKYSSQQITDILNYQFIPLRKTIQDTCHFLKENNI